MDYTNDFQFTDGDLKKAGLLDVSQIVTQTIETMKKYPKLLSLTLFMLQCQNDLYHCNLPSPPTSSPLSEASATFSQLATTLDATAVSPYVISEYERATYYSGISPDPPELLYRSDLLVNPFPIPQGRHSHLPTKTVYGVFNTALNLVWNTVAPQIRDLLNNRSIQYSVIKAARFVTHGEDGKDTLGPVVIWIATHPTTTTAENAHDASPDILNLLKTNGVEGVVVEWYEGAVEKLSGPALLRVTNDINPTHHVRRVFTAALGMPITTAEREGDDAQGSVAFFFHANKTKTGDTSARVFGVSNNHVLRRDTTIAYEFKGAGAPRQYVRLAGFRRFQRALDEIKALISSHVTNANLLAMEIVGLEEKPKSKDEDEDEDDKEALKAKQAKLGTVKKDAIALEAFYKEINAQWGDIAHRNIGHVDWAPGISVDNHGHRYTKDIATFRVDVGKFEAQFKGNVVDLGVKFTPHELINMFYPRSNSRTIFKFPDNRQFRIQGCVTRERLAAPDCYDSNGELCLIVMKDGNTTDLTVGRYAGLEAYLCDELGVESIELAIYNYHSQSGAFSDKGDSGSLIFDGEGHMVGILHSGMPKGASNHVTFATPAWWVIEQIKLHYPDADFNRTTF